MLRLGDSLPEHLVPQLLQLGLHSVIGLGLDDVRGGTGPNAHKDRLSRLLHLLDDLCCPLSNLSDTHDLHTCTPEVIHAPILALVATLSRTFPYLTSLRSCPLDP